MERSADIMHRLKLFKSSDLKLRCSIRVSIQQLSSLKGHAEAIFAQIWINAVLS
jgi:hypothetical protein